MKNLLLLSAIFLLSSTNGFAVLSPLNQSIKEIESIISNPELTENLPQAESILNIYQKDNGYFLVTQNYEIFVEVKYLPAKRPGPLQYHLVFYKPSKVNH